MFKTEICELFGIEYPGSIKACVEGDWEEGTIYCGQIGGYIREMKSARGVIEETIAEAKSIVA